MRLKSKIAGLSLVAAALTLSESSAAVTAFGGIQGVIASPKYSFDHQVSKDLTNPQSGTLESAVDSAFGTEKALSGGAGVRLGVLFSNNNIQYGLQASGSMLWASQSGADPVTAGVSGLSIPSETSSLTNSTVFNFRTKWLIDVLGRIGIQNDKAAVYALLGVSFARTQVKYLESDTTSTGNLAVGALPATVKDKNINSFGIAVGAGASMAVTQSFALSLEGYVSFPWSGKDVLDQSELYTSNTATVTDATTLLGTVKDFKPLITTVRLAADFTLPI